MHVFANDAVRFFGREGDVAGDLRVVMRDPLGAEAEGRGIGVSGLHLEALPVDGAAIEARRRAGLEAAAAQAEVLQSFAQEHGGWFPGAAGGILLLAAVDQAIEESAGGDDDGLGADGAAVAESDALDGSQDAVASGQSPVVSKRSVVGCRFSVVGKSRALLGWTAGGGCPYVGIG